jgi:lipoate-protein ligase B
MTEKRKCLAVWLGLTPYDEANRLQLRIADLKKRGFDSDVLLLLEHPPTITMGRRAKQNNLLVQEKNLEDRGVELWKSDRGGDITFHGPGQLVGYPILFLRHGERDVHRYMHNLEASLLRLLSSFGIHAGREDPFTGVWAEGGKIAAMGVHLSRWVTRHGFALNVTTDLSYFQLIVPCGIAGRRVTSMREILECPLLLGEVVSRYVPIFGDIFYRAIEVIGIDELDRRLTAFEKTVKKDN